MEAASQDRSSGKLSTGAAGGVPGAWADASAEVAATDDVFVLPASSTQRRLWFLDKFSKTGGAYNVFCAFAIEGPLNPQLLQHALDVVVARHESLRASFNATAEAVTQVVSPHLSAALETVPWPKAADSDERFRRELTSEAGRPFDLSAAPLLRMRLYERGAHDYVLSIAAHHIVLDGWSQGLLLREIAIVYNAAAAGREPELPALSLQHGDFAIWEQQSSDQGAFDLGLAFWKQHLAGELSSLELPADRPRPLAPSYRGQTLSFVLPRRTGEQLAALTQSEGVSLFIVALGALMTLLHRYTGQNDILVGSPIANRLRAELEACIGFFANTVVFRGDLSGRPTFRDLIQRLRTMSFGVMAHQDVPFDRVVHAVQAGQGQSQNPLFQVMLAAQRVPDHLLPLDGLDVRPLFVDNETAKFDLLIELRERSAVTDGFLEYSTDLFDRPTAERIRTHFVNLLSAAVAEPDRPIEDYELMEAVERDRIVRAFNETAVAYPAEALVHTLVAAQVGRTPHVRAVEGDDGRALTFLELDERANRLAHRLRASAIGPGRFVAVCLERSPELIVALVATLKAGAAYVPLDVDYPTDRLAFMLEDSGASVLITSTALQARLGLEAPETVLIDAIDTAVHDEWPAHAPEELAGPDTAAYMIYTSGSTGRPKGVLIAHRAICNQLAWMRDEYTVGPGTVLMQRTPISFDVSVTELFLPLMTGARMVLARPGSHGDPDYLLDLIRSRQVTLMQFVPSLLREFVEQERLERARSLKDVTCIGEALPTDLRDRFYARFSCNLHNLYGPTEAAVQVMYWDCGRTSATPSVPIGRPCANTTIYILDAHRRPVPIGVPGELCIGGVQVGLGYHNRPELTAERFIPDPFSSEAGARLYRTGDWCRYLPSDAVEFLGRLDHQVKIRGFRIELGEVEAALQSHVAVRDAVVVAQDDPTGKRLVGYVVPADVRETPATGTSTLERDHLADWEHTWNERYTRVSARSESTFDTEGWNSSYTGARLTEDEMREWLDATVERISSLNPSRIWEIGCGTGMLLYRLAPTCDAYLGTDASEIVIARLARDTAHMGMVRTMCRAADAAPDGVANAFDTVVLNSVAQYLPSVDYLQRVVDLAISAVRDGGAVFLGDIRDLRRLEAFHAGLQLYRTSDALPTAQLRERVQRSIAQEHELVLHPDFFATLAARHPRVTGVEVMVKRGRHHNEMACFRYDVVLRVGAQGDRAGAGDCADGTAADVDGVRQWLGDHGRGGGRLCGVPDARVTTAFRLLQLMNGPDAPATVGDLRRALSATPSGGIDPDLLWTLDPGAGRQLIVVPSAAGAHAVDLVVRTEAGDGATSIIPAPEPAQHAGAPAPHANDPLQGMYIRWLLSELRDYLGQRLPEYMVPAVLVPLDKLPLAPNGKVDRRALPSPDPRRVEGHAGPPQNEVEAKLIEIWSEVMEVSGIGRTDDFFSLGGHSLLAARLLMRINKALGTRLPLAALLESRTIAGLAERARSGSASDTGRNIVWLSPDGNGTPLFFVHPLGGSVSEYLPLARYMAPDQPFAGLRVPLEDGVPDWTLSIESMASRYVSEICNARPEGPVCVGGWSGGATVALEMAQQLRARGRDVPLVIALDASPFNVGGGTPPASPAYAWKLVRNLPHWIRDDAMQNGAFDLVKRVGRKLKSFVERLSARRVGQSAAAEVGGFLDMSLLSADHRRFMEQYFVALRRYVPRRYDGVVLLFKARTQPLYHLIEPERMWPRISPRTEVQMVPCTHLSIVAEPHAQAVAAGIKMKMKQVGS